MKILNSLNDVKISAFIREVRGFEISHDLEGLTDLFISSEFWSDFNKPPDISYFPEQMHGEIMRLSGYFLSNYGRAKQKTEYQERGKDLLFNATAFFEMKGQADKAAESKCQLALCYWREGAINEAEAFLDNAELPFKDNDLHPAFLRIQVNRMIVLYWSDRLVEAESIIESIGFGVEISGNDYLRTMFHNQSGLVYTRLENYEKTIFHLHETVRFTKIIQSPRLTAKALNNLAYCYFKFNNTEKAENCINESIQIFKRLGDTGWLATALDTKANILLAKGDTVGASCAVKRSLEILGNSGDAVSAVETLWTQTQIQLAENNTAAALVSFAELVQIAQINIGEFAVNQYSAKLSEYFPAPKNQVVKEDYFYDAVTPIDIDNLEKGEQAFFVPVEYAERLNCYDDLVVVIKPDRKAAGKPCVLFLFEQSVFEVGFVEFESFIGMFFISDETPQPFCGHEAKIIGSIVRYKTLGDDEFIEL